MALPGKLSSQLLENFNAHLFVWKRPEQIAPPIACASSSSAGDAREKRSDSSPHALDGADEEQKESTMRSKSAETTVTCPFCLDDFNLVDSKDIIRVLPCNDMTCHDCLVQLLTANRDAK
jgi:hypothetical protein